MNRTMLATMREPAHKRRWPYSHDLIRIRSRADRRKTRSSSDGRIGMPPVTYGAAIFSLPLGQLVAGGSGRAARLREHGQTTPARPEHAEVQTDAERAIVSSQ